MTDREVNGPTSRGATATHKRDDGTMAANPWIAHRERYDTMLAPFSVQLFDAAALQPAEHVIDIGCGTGSTTLEAAHRVGSTGTVIGIDIAADVGDVARERAAGFSNVSIVTADATIYRPPRLVDAVISRFGTMLFRDADAAHCALADMVRPGGRLALVVWQSMQANLWHYVPFQAVQANTAHGPAGLPDAPGPFALGDPRRLTAILEHAGLRSIELRSIERSIWVATDIDDAVQFFNDDAGAHLRAAFGPEATEAILCTVATMLQPFAGSEGVMLPAAAWLVTATRP